MVQGIAEAVNKLEEAMVQTAKWRHLNPAIATIRRAMAKAFRAQGFEVLQAMKAKRSQFPVVQEVITPSEFDATLEAAFRKTEADMTRGISEGTAKALETGAADTISAAGVDIAFDLKNPRAVAWLEANAAQAVTAVDATTKAEIRRIMTEAVDKGWSYGKSSKTIRDTFEGFAFKKPQLHIRDRATLVAVTESANAYEEGSRESIDEMTAAGLTMEKDWLTVGDDRVSDECAANEAQGWIAVEADFLSGHQHPPRFPGCRCTSRYRRKK